MEENVSQPKPDNQTEDKMREEIKQHVTAEADKQFINEETKKLISKEVKEALKGTIAKKIIAKEDYYKARKESYFNIATLFGFLIMAALQRYSFIVWVAALFMGLQIYRVFMGEKYREYLNKKYEIEPHKLKGKTAGM